VTGNEEDAMADASACPGEPVRTLAEADRELGFAPALVSIQGPRPENEDAGFTGPSLLVVADGVGGNVGGAVASSLAVEVVRAAFEQPRPEPPGGRLVPAVVAANDRLGSAVAAHPGLAGMATTLTAAAITGSRVTVAHVGDSRAYLLRGGRLQQLTHDQTVVQSLVDAGVVGEQQARTHPLRSVLLAALHGAPDDPQHVEVIRSDALPGDRLLLCSDGLSGAVDAAVLERVLVEEALPAAAATRLVRAALAAGTHDNVTVVVADVVPAAPVR
jgi:protein phosphatase